MRETRWLLLTTALLLATPAAAAAQADDEDQDWIERCEDNGDGDRERYCEVRVERLDARGEIVVDAGRNGGAIFIGQDRSDIEVHVRIQAQARSESRARAIAGDVTFTTDGTVRSDGPDTERGENWSATFVVYVPRRTDVEAQTYNGPVSARDIDGRVRLDTYNGPITLKNLAGDTRASTRNGPLYVELTGTGWQGAGLDAETRNGPVTLEVPDDYNAELVTGTINGPMSSDLPLTVEFMGGRRHLNATLGTGGTKLRVVTHNGPFSLRRS